MQAQHATFISTIAVTGVRNLSSLNQRNYVEDVLENLETDLFLVGDATGVDEIAIAIAVLNEIQCEVFKKDLRLPFKAQGAERSTRMIKELNKYKGILIAFPNKPCPLTLKPSKAWGKAQGSGTWGTIAIAVGHGLEVKLYPLTEIELPAWMHS